MNENNNNNETSPETEPVAEGPSVAELRLENERLKGEIRTAEAHRLITGELSTAGARSPELLFGAVERDLQFGDDGKLQNAAALIDTLRQRYPEQFAQRRTPSIDAGSGAAPPPRLTRSALAKMAPAEIAKLDWDEVRRVLAS